MNSLNTCLVAYFTPVSTATYSYTGVFSATITVVRNGIGGPGSNPGLAFYFVLMLWKKNMNLFVQPTTPVIGK